MPTRSPPPSTRTVLPVADLVPDLEALKKAAGVRAAALVENGMRVGLGTGSTAKYAIEEIGRRLSAG